MAESDRIVQLEGCFNFRDLGGHPAYQGRRLRHGQLFRSDALCHLTPEAVVRVRDVLGIRTVVDLRSTAERALEAPGALCAPPVTVHHVPLFASGRRGGGARVRLSLGQIYALMLQFAREPIRRAIEILSTSEEPAVFHCAAGKDRTGVLAAIVLGALGVPDAAIVEDYAETRRSLPRIVDRLRESTSYRTVFTELPADTLHAEPATMEELLAHVRARYGSMRGYLHEAGLPSAALEALERRLLA